MPRREPWSTLRTRCQRGTDTFQYIVTNVGAPNAGLASQPATVTINLITQTPTVPAAAPVAEDDTFGNPVTIQLVGTSPVSGQALTYSISTQPTQGTLSQLNATTGTVIYTPNAGAQGTDTFQYIVTNTGGSPRGHWPVNRRP